MRSKCGEDGGTVPPSQRVASPDRHAGADLGGRAEQCEHAADGEAAKVP